MTPTSRPPTRPRSRLSRSFASRPTEWGKKHPDKNGKPSRNPAVRHDLGRRRQSALLVLAVIRKPSSSTTPQVLVQLTDKDVTPEFVDQVQPVLSRDDARRAHATTGSCKPIH